MNEKSMKRINRKTFLVSATVSFVSYLFTISCRDVVGWLLGKKEPNPEDRLTKEQESRVLEFCRSFYSSDSNYRIIGEEYLARFPREDSYPYLINAVYPKKGSESLKSLAKFRKVISQKIQSDFKKGDFLYMNNWMLSRTEVRLAGIQYKWEYNIQ